MPAPGFGRPILQKLLQEASFLRGHAHALAVDGVEAAIESPIGSRPRGNELS